MKKKPDGEESRVPNKRIVERRVALEERILEIDREMRPLDQALRRAERALKALQTVCKHPNMVSHGAVGNCPDCHFRTMHC